MPLKKRKTIRGLNTGCQGASDLPDAEKNVGGAENRFATVDLAERRQEERPNNVAEQIDADRHGTHSGVRVCRIPCPGGRYPATRLTRQRRDEGDGGHEADNQPLLRLGEFRGISGSSWASQPTMPSSRFDVGMGVHAIRSRVFLRLTELSTPETLLFTLLRLLMRWRSAASCFCDGISQEISLGGKGGAFLFANPVGKRKPQKAGRWAWRPGRTNKRMG